MRTPSWQDAGARAMAVAHGGDDRRYDAIAARYLAAVPATGPVPLKPLLREPATPKTALERRLDVLEERRRLLLPRALYAPEGRTSAEVTKLHFHLRSLGSGEERIYSRAQPPAFLRAISRPQDAPRHRYFDLPDVHWISLSSVLWRGRFERMDRCAADLTRTREGPFYSFISHRWRTPEQPDPSGGQCVALCWQFFLALIDAVRVAHDRGLHAPRQICEFSSGPCIGVYGSDLSESMVVNLLRVTLDDADVARLWPQVAGLGLFPVARSATAVPVDRRLDCVRAALLASSSLRALFDQLYIWYDYSCLPGEPRSSAEKAQLETLLEGLLTTLHLGTPVLVMNDAVGYLQRGWCVVEALYADASSLGYAIVGDADEADLANPEIGDEFESVLLDRGHIVWRAVLDTELLRVQSPPECLQRLDLSLSDAGDTDFIYRSLCALPFIRRIHFDEAELVTGAIPLPLLQDHFLPLSFDKDEAVEAPAHTFATIDTRGALQLRSLDAARLGDLACPFARLASDEPDETSLHIAVIGACEGEALLMREWVEAHLEMLAAVGKGVPATLSWAASDIAPVGAFVRGSLELQPVRAKRWMLVSTAGRLARCGVVRRIRNLLDVVRIDHDEVALDAATNNVRHVVARQTDGSLGVIDLRSATAPVYPGGLLLGDLDKIAKG